MQQIEHHHVTDALARENEQRASLFLSSLTASQAELDAALHDNFVWYERRGGSLRGFTAPYLDSGQVSFGTLVNRLDRERARRAGFDGTLTELAARGKLLRDGTPPEALRRMEADAHHLLLRVLLNVPEGSPDLVDDLTPEQVTARLLKMGVTEREMRDARMTALSSTASRESAERRETFQQAQERTRALVREAAPTAPAAPLEADTLNLQALEVLASARPQEYRAALEVAQTGDLSGFNDYAVRPMSYGDWLKQHGRCWVSGRLPVAGEVFDLHHVAYGDYEARRGDGGPQVLASVSRAAHIPQPFSDRETAHSKAWTVGHDPARLIALLEYQAREWARYQAFIRGESDPAESEEA